MNNAQIGDKILEYDNEQTTVINANKNKNETLEESVLTTNQKLTNLDNKLSKDYIIDFGIDNNSYWEKWNSGKLIMYGFSDPTNASGSVNIDIVTPVNSMNTYYMNARIRTLQQGANRIKIDRVIHTGYNVRVSVTTDGDLTGIVVYWEVKGMWK